MSRSADDLLRYHAKFMIADSMLHLFGFNFTKLDIDKSRSFAISTQRREGRRRSAEAVRGGLDASAVRAAQVAPGRQSRERDARR